MEMATRTAATRTMTTFLPLASLVVEDAAESWTGTPSVSLIRAPHLQQNTLSSGFSAPQCMQYTTRLPSCPLPCVRRHLNYRTDRFRALAPSHAPIEAFLPFRISGLLRSYSKGTANAPPYRAVFGSLRQERLSGGRPRDTSATRRLWEEVQTSSQRAPT
jgi:hypothetical protein